jgi:DNA-binding winged helix-turn-helix (wHTH) protein/tetratricopeptide (TPR) repeat protein
MSVTSKIDRVSLPSDSLEPSAKSFSFGPFTLDANERILSRDGVPIQVSPRAFDTLLLLVDRAPHLLSKSALMNAVWAESFVEETNLTVVISVLRKSLGDDGQERKYIQTVPKLGYRFIADVKRNTAEASQAHASSSASAAMVEQVATLPQANVATIEEEHSNSASRVKAWFQNTKRTGIVAAGISALILLSVFALPHLRRHPVDLKSVRSVAVLPFKAEDPGGNKPYLGVGVANSIISRLGGSDKLMVPSSNTIARLSDSVLSSDLKVGRELGVDAVVNGTIDFSPTETKVSVALTGASDGQVLWSNTFTQSPQQTSDLADVLEEDIASRVSSSILEALGNVKSAHTTVDTANPEARELYFLGRSYWNRRTESSLTKSIDSFQKAIAADPNFALAYSGLADSYVLVGSFSVEPGRQAISSARSAALSALQLDPGLAEPHASLGMISFFTDWDGSAAEQEFQRALALQPNYATAHHWYALDLAAMGRLDQASYEVHKAQSLDPLSSMIATNVGWVYYLNRQYPEAEQAFRKVLEVDPGFVRAHTRLGITLLTEGKNQEAQRELQQALALSGDPYVKGLLAQSLAASGKKAEANRMLSDLIKDSHTRYVQPFGVSLAYLGLGQRDKALEWLQKAFDDHTTTMVWAKVDPELDQLRDTPEFKSMLSRVKF